MTVSQKTQGISVVLCSYNNAQFLDRCIASIIAQDVTPLEIIILDDASTDHTQDVLRPYQDRAGFILLKNDHNLGLTKSLNIAIAAARYPLIARIDADDVMLPGRLAYQAQCLADDNIILSGSGAILDYEDEGIILTPKSDECLIQRDDPFLSNPFAHSSVTFKRTAYDAVGGYDENFTKCQDFDLWKRMKDHGQLHLTARHLIKRSIHDEMITRKSAVSQFKFTQRIRYRHIAVSCLLTALLLMIRDAIFIMVPHIIKRIFIWKKHTDEVIEYLLSDDNRPVMIHLCTSMQIGGAQISMLSMLKNPHYTASYRACVVAFGENSTLIQRLINNGTPVANFRISGLVSAIFAYLYLHRLIKRIKPKSLYSWLYHTHFMSIPTKLNFPSLKIYWAVHSWKRDFLNKRTDMVLSICARASRWVPWRIIYASEASRNIHADYGFTSQKATVIENGIRLIKPQPTEMFTKERQMFDQLNGKIVIGTVSRYAAEKDIGTFIAMAARLKARHASSHFVMIGAGLSPQNTELCQSLSAAGVRNETTLVEVSSDLGTWLQRMNIFCLSSKSESFPLVIGEAILVGTIPVSTDVGGVRKIIPQDAIIAPQLVVPSVDAESLADAISHVITLPAEDQDACLHQLQQHINNHFSEDQYVMKHKDLFSV